MRDMGEPGEQLGAVFGEREQCGNWMLEQLSDEGEFVPAMAVGEEAAKANTLESIWQGVEQEAADECVHLQCHGALALSMPVILPAKTHLAVVGGDEPMVGEGDAMGITAEILKHLPGSAKRGLGIDNPIGFP